MIRKKSHKQAGAAHIAESALKGLGIGLLAVSPLTHPASPAYLGKVFPTGIQMDNFPKPDHERKPDEQDDCSPNRGCITT